MSRRLGARSVTIALCAAAALFGMATLSSCASGSDALTGLARTTTNSVSGAKGSIALRNVYVVGPVRAGGSTQVISAFFNNGADEDEIIGVYSPAAAAGRPPASAVLAPGGTNIYIADGSAPTLFDLDADLEVGAAVPVTFTFAKAGSVTLLAPVESPAPGAWVAPPSTVAPTAATPTPTTPTPATPAGPGAGPASATPQPTAPTPTAATPTAPTPTPTSPAA